MKKYLVPVAIFSSVLFIMGMGELGGTAPADKIPVPGKNFNTLVVDREGVQTALSQFSFEGKAFLSGKRGSATIAIPFEKIFQVELQGQEGSEVLAKVTFLDKKSIEVKMDKRSKFYGKAEFGTFQIEIKDLKSIRFQL
jgi:hypothetical protein